MPIVFTESHDGIQRQPGALTMEGVVEKCDDKGVDPLSPSTIDSFDEKPTTTIDDNRKDAGTQATRHRDLRRSAVHRVGISALGSLCVTTVITVAVIAFYTFLWLGKENNYIWHHIMINGWAPRAITIPSLILRAATGLQLGVMSAMLAALALENGSVRLQDAAILSILRASRGTPRKLLLPLISGLKLEWSATRLRCCVITATTGVMVLGSILLQFTSTILLSDLRLGQLPGNTYTSAVFYDFMYTPEPASNYGTSLGGYALQFADYPARIGVSTVQRNPPAYPTFGEYSQPVESSSVGIDDTGILLRAFLPFSDAQSRQSVRNYSGKAMVLDSRVSCQRPELTGLYFESGTSDFTAGQVVNLLGIVSPSLPKADRLWTPGPIPFNCTYVIGNDTLSICSLQGSMSLATGASLANRGGGLISEFANITNVSLLQSFSQDRTAFITWGTPFVVLHIEKTFFDPSKITTLTEDDLSSVAWNGSFANTSITIEPGTASSIWTNMSFSEGRSKASLSLCYTVSG